MARNIRKSIFLILALVSTLSLSAQHYLGVRGGYGGGSVRFDPPRETGILLGYPSAGISWKYYSPVKIVGAIELDLQYVQKGYKQFTRVGGDTSYQRTIQAIEMPFMWQPHVYMFNRKVRAFLNLGVYLSHIIGSDTSTVSKMNGVLYGKGKYLMRSVRDNSWEYGLCGGAGISVLIHRFEVLVEARYSFGYSDLLKNGTKYPGNPQRSPMDMINVSFGLYYRLGKGGILAPPSAKRMRIIESTTNNQGNGNNTPTKNFKTNPQGRQ